MSGSRENYILIVDDDESVLNFMAAVLRLEGHRVLKATSGPLAVGLAEKWGAETLALLITDIMMPEMDGYALASELAGRRHALPVLYVSGFSERELGARTVVQPAAPLLCKPFSADELRSVVRKVLTAKHSAQSS